MNAPLLATVLLNPFPLPQRASLAEVYDLIQESALAATRKRDCLSALRRVAHLLGRDLSALPSDPGILRDELARLHPASLGL